MRPIDLPDASHFPHGTRARYVSARCRCVPCRAANSRYQTTRELAKKRGEWNGLVPAAAARAHLLALSRQGVGRRAVQAASDVSSSVLTEIRAGRKTHIRALTERRILAVDRSCIADHALVPAAPAWRLINRLKAEGYPALRLVRFLGYGRRTMGLQFGRRTMTARNVRRVQQLFARLMAVS